MISEEGLQQLLENQGRAQSKQQSAKRNKYGVAPKAERTVGCLTFASKAEADAYKTLLMLESTGQITKLELQPVFKFEMGFSYVADFRITWADGSVEVIDVKGYLTPVFKLKAKCMAYFYPDMKLVIWK